MKMDKRLTPLLVSLILQVAFFSSGVGGEVPTKGATAPAPVSGKSTITLANDLLTAKLESSSLLGVLEEIEKKSGVRIFLSAPTDERVTVEFRNLPVAEGLRQILQRRSFAYFYSWTSAGHGKIPVLELRKVRVLAPTGGAADLRAAPNTLEVRAKQVVSQPEARPGHREEFVSELLLRGSLNGRGGSQLSKEAAEALGKTWDPRAVEPLTAALSENEDPSVRAAAAKSLGKTWSEDAVAPLARALLEDSSALVREAAANALGETWSAYVTESLTYALLYDADALVREQAARALGETSGQEAVNPLMWALLQDPRWYVRDGAASALGAIGSPEAGWALVKSATDDPDAWVRETAAVAAQNVFH